MPQCKSGICFDCRERAFTRGSPISLGMGLWRADRQQRGRESYDCTEGHRLDCCIAPPVCRAEGILLENSSYFSFSISAWAAAGFRTLAPEMK